MKKRSAPPTEPQRPPANRITWRGRRDDNIKGIETLDDLITMAWNYRGDAFDWERLWDLIPALTELNNMVGLTKIKETVVDLVVCRIQNLTPSDECYHTVLSGSPGTGKTTCAKILAKIFYGIGLVASDRVVVADRTCFVDKYIGWSERRTNELVERSLGGVLFIDDAYSLGDGSHTDSFSKASLDVLTTALTNHRSKMICIVAGYEKELEQNFFAINPGLKSRFPIRLVMDSYTGSHISRLFRTKIERDGWSVDPESNVDSVIEANSSKFVAFGRDVDNFIGICKRTHSRRIFGSTNGVKTITSEDIERAMTKFSSTLSSSTAYGPPAGMYI